MYDDVEWMCCNVTYCVVETSNWLMTMVFSRVQSGLDARQQDGIVESSSAAQKSSTAASKHLVYSNLVIIYLKNNEWYNGSLIPCRAFARIPRPTKLADFKRRTGRMDKIMAKVEQEMCNFIRKKMLLLEKEHKKLFT